MESFSIACTTCRVQLRVRDAAAVGQILTCPKCGSMVLVEPPEARATPEVPPAKKPPPRPQPPSVAELAAGSRSPGDDDSQSESDTVEDLSLYGLEEATREIESREPGNRGLQPPTDGTTPLLPTDEWTSTETLRWRNSALVAGAGVIGVVLAVGLFGLVSGQLSGTTSSRAAAAPSTGSPAETESVSQRPPDEESPAEPVTENTSATASPDSAAASGDVPGQQPADPADQTASPPVEAAELDATDEQELVPAGFTPAAETPDSESLARALDQFESELGSPASLPEADEADPPPVEAASTPASPGETLPRPTPREIDVAARLSDAVQKIEFRQTRLIAFLQFMSELSTIPISLHPESLLWLKLTPASAVSIDQSESTVAAILTGGLRPLGLGFTIVDEQLIVGRPSATEEGELRRVRFDIADLCSDEQAAEGLAELVSDLIAPAAWRSKGGAGEISVEDSTLVVQQQDEVLFELLFFLEKLRVARGLAPRSRYAARLFQLETRRIRAAAQLAQTVSLNYIQPTSFRAIVGRLGATTGTHLLIDWHALAEIGWTQDSQVSFQVMDQPFGEALAALLEPMELSYRVVDQTVLQITTPGRLDSIDEIEFYATRSFQPGATEEEWRRRLQSELGPRLEGRGTLRFDAASQCLIVLAPQPVQDAVFEVLTREGGGG